MCVPRLFSFGRFELWLARMCCCAMSQFGSTFVERVAMLAFANREPDKNRGFGFTRRRDMP